MANRTNLTAKKRKAFLSALAKTGNVTLAAKYIGVTRQCAYYAREKDEEFGAAWDDAVEQATDLLEMEARRRAFKGTMKPVFYKGRICGRVKEYSDSLLMFLIKGKRPEYATERRQLSSPGGAPMEYNVHVHTWADVPPDAKDYAEWAKFHSDAAVESEGNAEEALAKLKASLEVDGEVDGE